MHLERTVHFCTKVFSVFAIVCGKFFSLKYESLKIKKKQKTSSVEQNGFM